MTEEEKLQENIKAISAQLDALQKRQQYLATKRKEAEAAKHTNQIGFYAAKTCREALDVIKMAAAQLDVDKQTDHDILTTFTLINRNSWTAIKALERDATERGEQ
jgi:prefoldin subunit 5